MEVALLAFAVLCPFASLRQGTEMSAQMTMQKRGHIPPPAPGVAPATYKAIHLLFGGQDLSADEADAAMMEIMQGEATPTQIGAFLAALRVKGESVAEITGCARAMRRNAVRVTPEIGDQPLIDVVGTGGDGTGTFNISTTAALVVAGAGRKVAKHGNRSISSKCGAADVLGALGVNINLTATQAERCIEEAGIAFLFAPVYHPAMKNAIGPRRELSARTVFNILGPLTNPAYATHMLVGVYDPELTEPVAAVLGEMGAKAAYVVHGDGGVDELSISGASRVTHLRNGTLRTFDVTPEALGLERAPFSTLLGGDALENAATTLGILRGEIQDARRDAVLLNAAFALTTESDDPRTGVEIARQSIDSGAAVATLERFVALSHEAA